METKKQGAGPRDLGRSLGFLVHDVARLMRRAFDRRVKHLGLTRSQWFVLVHLYRTDGQTQRHLAQELDMERAPLSKLLDRLESGSWIERRADPDDRRANRVYITHKIDPIMNEIISVGETLTDDIFSGIDKSAREEFLSVLVKAKSNLIAKEQQEV
ncbi:MarR family transcriptional regulator [Congregibacter brevis]|jgi:DNA-binding MarR family transcriptional regulator|uniref:MarR family transcriptional regulator n=1 Tax=Congregibacter brevis TaxID=3081201 RepID=A0ABZ0IGA1_9GAMM|nr:MarR family transcriptional regulator [Congregibacter sp. IMCC45268]